MTPKLTPSGTRSYMAARMQELRKIQPVNVRRDVQAPPPSSRGTSARVARKISCRRFRGTFLLISCPRIRPVCLQAQWWNSCLQKPKSACSAPPAIPARNWCGCCCAIRSVEIALLTADRRAGQGDAPTCFRNSRRIALPKLVSIEGVDWKALGLDLVFCALPHGTTQKVIKDLLARAPTTKVVDLSADFRLADPAAYARWYGHEHHAPELQKEAVYGLAEVYRVADQDGAARRQSRLLHDLRRARADPAAESQGDRSRRDRHRRQIGHDRSGQGGERGDAVFGSVGGLPCLRRRPSPPHGRTRPGILHGRRPRGRRDLHAASRADEPRHPVDHLCARPQGFAAGPSCAAV